MLYHVLADCYITVSLREAWCTFFFFLFNWGMGGLQLYVQGGWGI